MRKKIKDILNKEEGFTLVELLAVIVILGIILAIAIPAVGSVMDNAQSNATDAEVALVEDAARLYFVENPDEDSVEVSYLIDNGYLELRGKTDAQITEIRSMSDITKQSSSTPAEDEEQDEG